MIVRPNLPTGLPLRDTPDISSLSCNTVLPSEDLTILNEDSPKLGTAHWIKVHKGITTGYVQGKYLYPRVLAGLHGPADPGEYALDDEAYQVIKTSKVETVKLLAAADMGGGTVSRLNQQGNYWNTARVFNLIDVGFPKDGIEYVREVEDSAIRLYNAGIRYFEIFNEPNLYSGSKPTDPKEGFGVVQRDSSGKVIKGWENGTQFALEWLKATVYLQTLMPEALFGFPAMSPGDPIENLRYDPVKFMQEAELAIQVADFLCFHTYWMDAGSTWVSSLKLIAEFANAYPDKLILVTEFSNPNPSVSKGVKGMEYASFYGEAKKALPYNVGALYSYCLSSSSGFESETWKGSSIPTIVGAAL